MSHSLSDGEIAALVDRLLLEQGRLDPLELLLAAGLLAYADYEAWRLGRASDLQGLLCAAPADAADLLRRAGAYAGAQKLSALPLEHNAWGEGSHSLRIGSHAGLVRGCVVVYAPPAVRPQLDLFHDSGTQLLEDEIRRALAERRTDAAREAVAQLMQREPRHRHLRGFLRLIQVIDEAGSGDPKDRLQELEGIDPVAHELLGHRARDFLAPLWAALAQALADRPFRPRSLRLHASFAWARAGRWEAAREAVESQSDWHRQPLLLIAHAEACWHDGKRAAARRDWVTLCWEHPSEAERVLGSRDLPDPYLSELWSRYGDVDLELETEDFPAWLLLQDSGAAAAVPAQAAPEDDRGDAYQLMCRLAGGEADIALRRELAEVHPGLLRLYLSSRG